MDDLGALALALGEALKARGWQLTTAESCTGGLVSASLTEIPGSSIWFERGFVTYSNAAKIELLGVESQTLEQFGAVSEQTALEMARGALHNSHAQVSLSITGIAGPDGGSKEKPVGTVCFAWNLPGKSPCSCTKKLNGSRQQIRHLSVATALEELLHLLG